MTGFYDLKRLFSLRAILDSLDPAGPPQALLPDPPASNKDKRVGVLPGSFNPPTSAHLELARHARKNFQLDHLLFAVSLVTIDKERVEGLSLEDRLLLLSLLAEELGWASVVAVNRGLYFEQARALRSLLGSKAKLYLIVGMDKLLQIFDPRYYQDREKALHSLFTEAQVIAAGRGRLGEEEHQRLLARKENEPYQDQVYFLGLPAAVSEISSSEIRSKIAMGESVQGKVPELVERFVAETGAYRSRYEFRRQLVACLYPVREWAEAEADFERLVKVAGEGAERGSKLRSLLAAPTVSPSQLKNLILDLQR